MRERRGEARSRCVSAFCANSFPVCTGGAPLNSFLQQVGHETELVFLHAGAPGVQQNPGVQFLVHETAEVQLIFCALVWHSKGRPLLATGRDSSGRKDRAAVSPAGSDALLVPVFLATVKALQNKLLSKAEFVVLHALFLSLGNNLAV